MLKFIWIILQLLWIQWIHAEICRSLDITSIEDLGKLHGCEIIVGHVSITNVLFDEFSEDEANPNQFLVKEITDYLLIYRANGLRSVSQIFPNLTLIRGQDLLFGEYALVVFENRNLLFLGITSLVRIQKGSIRIEANPLLCFVNTVNWIFLLGNRTEQHFSLKNNKSPNYCPQCVSESEYPINLQNQSTHCWNLESFQNQPSFRRFFNCPYECGSEGCSPNGSCCSQNCLTGCSSDGCKICATLKEDMKCVNECRDGYFQVDKRECVSAETCRRKNFIPFKGNCIESCPKNYIKISDNQERINCKLQCTGNYIIRTAKDLYSLRECITIHGSVTIELVETKTKIVELEQGLGNIKEITGYLKIVHSPQLLSLNFLRNLHTIQGTDLINKKYVLYVVDNHNLEQIWNANQKVALSNGHVYFHLNPRLCYEKIMQLQSSLKSGPKIPITDASPNSNGERVICGNNVRLLNASVEDFNATAARIKVDPMSAEDKDVLIGYVHHFREALKKNVTMFDGRHGCGHDNWRMDIAPSQNVRHIISNLKPYTQYAFFVKTLTMTSSHIQIDAYSKIQYFTTLPSKPGPVATMYYHTFSATQLDIHWWPPRRPNGKIEKYIVSYEKKDPEVLKKSYSTLLKTKNTKDSCQCPTVDPESSGPSPDDENYYNKEQITYEEALFNLIYVPRVIESPKKKLTPQNTTDLVYNTTINKTQSRIRRNTNEEHFTLTLNKSEKQGNITFLDQEKVNRFAEDVIERIRNALEIKALADQDTGIKDFHILKPPSICSYTDVSVQYQIENSCIPVEHYSGIEVPGDQHYLTLTNLEPEATYKISVRACAEGLQNGCGSLKSIFAETVSKNMETFLNGLGKFYD